jgi:cellobiose-specific phosphotransferase system component IIB
MFHIIAYYANQYAKLSTVLQQYDILLLYPHAKYFHEEAKKIDIIIDVICTHILANKHNSNVISCSELLECIFNLFHSSF